MAGWQVITRRCQIGIVRRRGEIGVLLFGFGLGDKCAQRCRTDEPRNGNNAIRIQLVTAARNEAVIGDGSWLPSL
jgi:hypothetical protein